MHKHIASVLLFSALFVTRHAAASPSFPAVLKDELGMACPPTCLVCHTTDPGESGSAGQLFAAALKDLGLEEKDDDSLRDALGLLGASDVDDDKSFDTDELAANPPSDPNDATLTATSPGVGMCDAEINYGCGAQIAPSQPSHLPSTLGLTFLWVVLLGAAVRVATSSRRKRLRPTR